MTFCDGWARRTEPYKKWANTRPTEQPSIDWRRTALGGVLYKSKQGQTRSLTVESRLAWVIKQKGGMTCIEVSERAINKRGEWIILPITRTLTANPYNMTHSSFSPFFTSRKPLSPTIVLNSSNFMNCSIVEQNHHTSICNWNKVSVKNYKFFFHTSPPLAFVVQNFNAMFLFGIGLQCSSITLENPT